MKLLLRSFPSLLLPLAAATQIVYTDLEPDTVLSATVQQAFERFDLDLDANGTHDFYLKHFHPFEGYRAAELYTSVGEGGEIAVDSANVPLALDHSDTVGPGLGGWTGTATQTSSNALFLAANWAGQQDRYAALRFRVDGQWRYAWLRLRIPSDTSEILVRDYAYEQQPGTPLPAGQTAATGVQGTPLPAFSIYPNPARDVLTLHFTASPRELGIVNALGACVFRQQTASNTLVLDVSAFPEGLYFVRAATRGTVHSQAVVIAPKH